MALVLDATPGGTASNTYCTRADADAYHEAHVAGSTWSAATTAARDAALAHATRVLDAEVEWRGLRAVSGQALAWPRTGLYHPDSGAAVDAASIPRPVREAAAELARLLLAGDRAEESAAASDGLAALRVGPVALEFTRGAARDVLGPGVRALLAPFLPAWGRLRPGSGGGAVPLQRG